MIFTDGTPPSDSILQSFLNVCEQYINDSSELESKNNEITLPNKIITNTNKSEGAVAVHCKGKYNNNYKRIKYFLT